MRKKRYVPRTQGFTDEEMQAIRERPQPVLIKKSLLKIKSQFPPQKPKVKMGRPKSTTRILKELLHTGFEIELFETARKSWLNSGAARSLLKQQNIKYEEIK